MNYIIIGILNFVYLGLRSFQTRNITFLHYKLMVLTNLFLVMSEVYIVGAIALAMIAQDLWRLFWTALAMWIGGVLGMGVSMYLHSHYVNK
jgi:hypothetical protein